MTDRQVTIVCGPPCSGKSTFVRENMQPGDLVVDYDDIARRLGSPVSHGHDYKYHAQVEATIARAIDGISQGRHERSWVIRSGVQQANDLAARLGGDLVVIDEPDDVLYERASRRDDPNRTKQAIKDWRWRHGSYHK